MHKYTKRLSLLIIGMLLILPQVVFAFSYAWNETQPAGDADKNWTKVSAMSADGQTILAGISGERLYLSTNGGTSWSETQPAGDADKTWLTSAMSADGQTILAGISGERLYLSTNGGDTWSETQPAGAANKSWVTSAMSADGQTILAGVNFGRLYLSTNGGSSWGETQPVGNINVGWSFSAMSADGQTILAGVQGGRLYLSTNGGTSWSETQPAGAVDRQWVFSPMSADGQTILAGATASNGRLYLSTNGGTSWSETQPVGDADMNWIASAMSADGQTILVDDYNGPIFISLNGGTNWSASDISSGSSLYLYPAMSADGETILAAISGGRLYIGTLEDASTDITPPTVITDTSLPLGNTGAVLRGIVTDTGGEIDTAHGFEYGTTMSYGSSVISTDLLFFPDPFLMVAQPLVCNTTYHYRAFATNSAGTGYGDDATFTTESCDTPQSILYGIDGSGSNGDAPQLYTLNFTTGEKLTTIGEVGYYVTGMAFHPDTGVLYGSTGGSGGVTKSLITISTTTGEGTLLGTIKNGGGTSLTMPDISFRSDGTLYGWAGSGSDLHIIDITSCDGDADTDCLATKVGEAGVGGSGNGLAFDSSDRLFLFGNADDSYYEIDPDTGFSLEETNFDNPSGDSRSLAAAAFNESDFLFASRLYFGEVQADLVMIDLDTNIIISTGEENSDMIYMDALAFYIPPVIPDTTTPVITILGSNPASVIQGDAYTDAGATASDDTDGDVTADINVTNSINTTTIGTYTVVYEVADAAANTAYATRTVNVIAEESGGGGGASRRRTDPPTGPTNSGNDENILRLQALIAELKAKLAILLGGTPAIQTNPFTRDLELGSTGPDVTALQTYLIGKNTGPKAQALATAGATGFFGPLTQAALAEFQASVGISPAVGYFGPVTKAYIQSH